MCGLTLFWRDLDAEMVDRCGNSLWTFWANVDLSTTFRSSVMVKRVFFTFLVTLTSTLRRFWPKNQGALQKRLPIYCEHLMFLFVKPWPVACPQTNIHTNKHTDTTDQHTWQNRRFSPSNNIAPAILVVELSKWHYLNIKSSAATCSRWERISISISREVMSPQSPKYAVF